MPCPQRFKQSLTEFNIDKKIVDEMNNGFEDLLDNSPQKQRAEYFTRCTKILDQKADPKTVSLLYQHNACCKSGARLTRAKHFAKENANLPLAEKILLTKDLLHMGKATLLDDQTIRLDAVNYYFAEAFHCGCPTFNKLKIEEVSRTYCCCCGGHFKYYYEIMLGVKLDLVEVVSSPLDSHGKNPCVFLFKILGK